MTDPLPLQQLVEALPEPALLFDDHRRLAGTNVAARELFDLGGQPYTPIQALGTAPLADLVHEVAVTLTTLHLEVELDSRHLAVTAAPVGNQVLLLLADHTDRARVDAVRRDFVANASHEMKTPVSGIQTLAEALMVTLDRQDLGRSRELAGRLADEADRLGRLITELLSLRRLEDDGAQVRTPVDLAALVTQELDAVADQAGRHGVAVRREIPDSAVVVGSEADLRLIVTNLLANAIGYNRDGGFVEVVLAAVEGAWRLVVTDGGIGIPRQDLDRIFERFYRVDIARSRATGGTGLGLSIVRNAVERHGGSVRVDSVLGEGSTFTVDLPVQTPGSQDRWAG